MREGGGGERLVVRSTRREREKEIVGTRWGRWRGLVWKISTSYKSAVARTENGGKGCRGDGDEGGCRMEGGVSREKKKEKERKRALASAHHRGSGEAR